LYALTPGLGISSKTADRYWVYAHAWLRREMDGREAVETKKEFGKAGKAISSH
jgi:hypothetical protein